MIGAGLENLVSVNDNVPDQIPHEYSLAQNYPNPFNSSTTISFALPKKELVTLKIYDLLGREVATLVNDFKEAGDYQVNFMANGLASAVYFYRIQAESFVEVRKMLFIR